MEGLDPKPFQFKKFSIYHHPAVMKVSTDSVLLGCWANVVNDHSILDVGCGSGLLSLMAAQRNSRAKVIGVDIQPKAIALSRYNLSKASVGNEIRFLEQNLFNWKPSMKFDHLLSNPPYFEDISRSQDSSRNIYRHAQKYFLEKLLIKGTEILKKGGRLSVVLPANKVAHFEKLVDQNSMYIHRSLSIYHTIRKPISLQLFEVRNTIAESTYRDQDKLILYDPEGQRTEAYTRLCRDFYL